MKRRSVKRIVFFLSIIVVFLPTGCSKNEVPEGDPVPLSGTTSIDSGGLDFEVPEGWIREAPKSAMRHSQYRLPGGAGDAELAVFAGIGGTPQQNIDRWINQFSNPEGGSAEESATVKATQVGSYAVTYLDVSGDFNGGMGPMAGAEATFENYRLLGAVIETPNGPWFLKLTGPIETVDEWEGSFKEFVESVG